MEHRDEDNNIEKLFNEVKDYIDVRLDLAKLQAVEQGSKLASAMTTGFILVLLFTLVVFFGSAALALYLGKLSGNYALGFAEVAGGYFLLAIIIYSGRHRWINRPMTNMFIRKTLNHDEDN